MLRLFQSIFTKDPTREGRYPEALVEAAIERAVDGTDLRIRAVPGYKRKLEPAVIHAIDHVIGLVDGFPPPVDVSGGYQSDPRLRFLLTSPNHMREVVSTDVAVREFLNTPVGRTAEHVVALMLLQLEERNVFGMEVEGDMVRRDVPQVTVAFTGRRFVDPAENADLARQLLQRRAFDHLLGIALDRITSAAMEQAGLEKERTLLRRKLKMLEAAGWTFEADAAAGTPSPAEIEAKLEEIEQQLGALGGRTGVLQLHLDRLIEVLARAQEQLWKERRHLIVDQMGIMRAGTSDTAFEINLDELHNVLGRTAVVLPVSIPRWEVRSGEDLVADVKRSLG